MMSSFSKKQKGAEPSIEDARKALDQICYPDRLLLLSRLTGVLYGYRAAEGKMGTNWANFGNLTENALDFLKTDPKKFSKAMHMILYNHVSWGLVEREDTKDGNFYRMTDKGLKLYENKAERSEKGKYSKMRRHDWETEQNITDFFKSTSE